MPEARPLDPLVLKFPLGVDNRSREYALPAGALRVADNLDVTRDGGLLSRKGLRPVLSGDCHSLWVSPGGSLALCVKDGWLSRLEATEQLTALIPVVGPVVYAALNGAVYWTDGVSVGQVTSTGTLGHWGVNPPPVPLCQAVAFGGLAAGPYQVAMTAVHPSGVESGVRDTVPVTVAAGGGIEVRAPTAATGIRFVVYRTPVFGGVAELRRATLLNAGQTVTLGVAELGARLESLGATAPVPGQCMVHHKGRLWVASGSVVWFTSEQSPHWLFADRGYYQFESPVTMLGAVEDGVYVGLGSRVYYLQGSDPYQMTQRPMALSGAAVGGGAEIPYDLFLGEGAFPSRQCGFWDTEGQLVIGKAGGILAHPLQKTYRAGGTQRGQVAYREHQGLRQLVSVVTAQPGPATVTDQAVLQVFAQGIVLNG